MKTIEVDSNDVISILSSFEKLLFISPYTLSENDVKLIHKAFNTIEKQKQPMVKMMYTLVFCELEKHEVEEITCIADFRQGKFHYSKTYKAATENEITDLINEEVEKKNAHYISSKNV